METRAVRTQKKGGLEEQGWGKKPSTVSETAPNLVDERTKGQTGQVLRPGGGQKGGVPEPWSGSAQLEPPGSTKWREQRGNSGEIRRGVPTQVF